MPKRYRPAEVVRVLESEGWIVVRQRGSHVMMKKVGNRSVITIPLSSREVGLGLFRDAIGKAELTPKQFDDKANEIL